MIRVNKGPSIKVFFSKSGLVYCRIIVHRLVMAVIRYAVLNDIHYPYEAQAYYAAIDQIRGWDNLRAIFLNGDICEIESVSAHAKGPQSMRLLQAEVEYANKKFDTLQRLFQGVPVYYLEGNHEFRVFRYIRDVAPELWGIISAPDLFKFSERLGWIFFPYGPTQLVKIGVTKDLYCRHEPLGGGATHAKGTAEKSVVSIIYGHTHQVQQYTSKKFGPVPYTVTAYSNGWLGDITKPCFDYRGSKDNWQLGFSMVECDERTGEYEVRFIKL